MPLPEPASTLLDVEQLQVAFPIRKGILKRIVDHNVVVKNISFTLRAGETLGLVGESGSGKSTTGLALLRLINSHGSIVFDGQPLQNLNRRQLLPIRHRIQVVFQIQTPHSTHDSTFCKLLRKAYGFTSRRFLPHNANNK